MFWLAFLVDPCQRGASAASVDNRSQDSTRTQCSSDLPPSPPCPPCCRTPGSREVSQGCFWFAFLVDPCQRGASAASVDNRSQGSTIERNVLVISRPHHHTPLVVEPLVLESSPRVLLGLFVLACFFLWGISCISSPPSSANTP